ncbi:29457_t:CDS:2, partial [Racocetra persica]
AITKGDEQVVGPVKVEVLTVQAPAVQAPAKLPGYKQYFGAIEKILQQYHKTQKRTAMINASPTLKTLNHARINKNTRVNE